MNNRNVGNIYEDMAVNFLISQGHEILKRNFSLRSAEIDIISKEKQENNLMGVSDYIVFTEVKYRSNSNFGNPYEAIGMAKQKKICKAASYYLHKNGFTPDTPIRFDVISIIDNEISWICNAFEYVL